MQIRGCWRLRTTEVAVYTVYPPSRTCFVVPAVYSLLGGAKSAEVNANPPGKNGHENCGTPGDISPSPSVRGRYQHLAVMPPAINFPLVLQKHWTEGTRQGSISWCRVVLPSATVCDGDHGERWATTRWCARTAAQRRRGKTGVTGRVAKCCVSRIVVGMGRGW